MKIRREEPVCAVKDNCETELFKIKSRHLDHLCEELESFGSSRFLDASSYEYFNVLLKEMYMRSSLRRASRM